MLQRTQYANSLKRHGRCLKIDNFLDLDNRRDGEKFLLNVMLLQLPINNWLGDS